VAAFMAGMGAGAVLGLRLCRGSPHPGRWLAACQGTLALLALLLVLGLKGLAAWPQPPAFLLHLGYFLILFPAGAAGGAIFSLATFRWRTHSPASPLRAGLAYAADLLGATLGSLVLGFLGLPIWGFLPLLLALAVLHTAAALNAWR